MQTAPSSLRRDLVTTAVLLLGVLAWDAAALDMPMARWFGGPAGFPWRDNAWLTTVLHSGARVAAWSLALWLCLAVWWPAGWLRRLDTRRRLQLAVTPLIAVAVVSGLKAFSATSCPWDLAAFGGVARYVSHWGWAVGADGGSGRCFPAGHAAAGFAFIGGWFAFRDRARPIARAWLVAAVFAGFALGLAQQARGAHFMSHTLWSAWLCWLVALVTDAIWRCSRPARQRLGAVAEVAKSP